MEQFQMRMSAFKGVSVHEPLLFTVTSDVKHSSEQLPEWVDWAIFCIIPEHALFTAPFGLVIIIFGLLYELGKSLLKKGKRR